MVFRPRVGYSRWRARKEELAMLVPASRLVNLYLFPPGRGIHALERVHAGALALGLDDVVLHAADGIVQFRTLGELQTRFRTGRVNLYGTDTIELDNQLDRSLTTVDTHLEGQIRLFPGAHPRAVAAGIIRPVLFLEGVAAITRQAFVQQRVSVDRMLEAYHAPALAPARADLPELDPMMARVAELNQQYGTSIDAYDRERPSVDRLRAAQERAQNCLAEIVVLILAGSLRGAPEQRERVAALLEPILRQNEAVRQSRRRRQPVQDIEPVDGIDLPGDDPPDSAPA
jgi:hypothetical protein